MFYASVAKPNPDGVEVDIFTYYLADRLGRTLGELEDIPHAEYLGWTSFHKVRAQREELTALRSTRG